jgi:hypothetical protein
MFYNPHDSKAMVISKHVIFWIGLTAMFGMFILLFTGDFLIPQHEVNIEINIKDRVNICLPEDDKFDKKSFFNF